jgi:prolyl 4-hydroxylase
MFKNIPFILFLFFLIFFSLVYGFCFYKKENFANDDYSIQEIDDFLTPEECDKIRELSKQKLVPSKVYSSNDDINDTQVRISDQCWLKDLDDPIIQRISERVAKITGTDINSQEELQVVKYSPGGYYRPHFDACNKETDDCSRLNKGLGPRYITFIIYLNDDFKDGETVFPKINTSIVPKRGKAAIFYNVDKDGEILPKSLHGGKDVKNGEKWIANKWIRLSQLAYKYQ